MRSITRVLLIAFMVALLPVRGWVGDAMAVEMAVSMASATKSVAQDQDSARTSGRVSSEKASETHSGCAGHASVAQGDDSQAASTSASDVCQGCSACQVCHTVALAAMGAGAPPSIRAQALPTMAESHFSSADTARGFKPPIS